MENAQGFLADLEWFQYHNGENRAQQITSRFEDPDLPSAGHYSAMEYQPQVLTDPCTYSEDDVFAEDDISLDAFGKYLPCRLRSTTKSTKQDKELLSQKVERLEERQSQAEKGLARMSLLRSEQTVLNQPPPHRLTEDLHTSHPGNSSSSSPGEAASSPIISALQNRAPQFKIPRKSREIYETSLQSPLKARHVNLDHAVPIVQGIQLVPATELPDRFRSIFPYPIFNAVQSKCFPVAFGTDDNLVLSAPTGSGKTVVMELAICRLIWACKNEDFKVVYQAPTKSLCSERYRDWYAKFGALDLECAELTGDTDYNQHLSVQSANIIITTPEKWDSVTRKWKDNAKFMELVRLFLIDEVHILKESRGATHEAVISRMKSMGINVRFVALSATVPNSDDIATWLGKRQDSQHLPARREMFGEQFRPVQLQKIVKGYAASGNDWAFDSMLATRIPEMIAQYSAKRPVMIFCHTRASAAKMSVQLAELWNATSASSRLWHGPKRLAKVKDSELQKCTPAGVAFHHGGLDVADRRAIEHGFLNGDIMIICSTSTLAIGVNLPCYLVIIKGTMGWSDNGLQEYSDLEMMQMLGRAGRPQFETSACAVILTKVEKVRRYERMVSGEELLESCLHQNLIDHLNAEIGLGSIYDIPSAKRWLASTFMFVRLRRNPDHYKLHESVNSSVGFDEDELIEQICRKNIKLLQEKGLVVAQPCFRLTEFGDAMARYCVRFDTMKNILALPPKAKLSEILSALVQAIEFKDIRFKAAEKLLYKELNKDASIKFPIKVDVSQQPHKVSLLIQTELGGCIFPTSERFKKHKHQFQVDKSVVFSHVNRLIRCIIDCQLHLEDSTSARNALELGRSLAAKVWDNSSLQLKQIDGIGDVGIRKLASAGINSIETLENTESNRIEMILCQNPPFGNQILYRVGEFPHLRVTVKRMEQQAEPGKGIKVKFLADIGFLNEKIPQIFRRRRVYVCFLAETSLGTLIDFRRIGANRFQNGLEILVTAQLSRPVSSINCFVMCDEIAGSSRQAVLKLAPIPASWFPPLETQFVADTACGCGPALMATDIRSFDDDNLADGDLLSIHVDGERVEVVEDIDEFLKDHWISKSKRASRKRSASHISANESIDDHEDRPWQEAVQLQNGRWSCQHACKDESKACKHKCCKEGVVKPTKRPKKKQIPDSVESASKISEGQMRKTKTVGSPFDLAIEATEKRKRGKATPGTQEDTGTLSSFSARSNNQHDEITGPKAKRKMSFNEDQYGIASAFGDSDWTIAGDADDLPDPAELLTKPRGGEDNRRAYSPVRLSSRAVPASVPTVGTRDRLGGQGRETVAAAALKIAQKVHNISHSAESTLKGIFSDHFDDDIDLEGFDTLQPHVRMAHAQKRSTLPPPTSSSKWYTKLPIEKGLFMTGESSSPSKMVPVHADDDAVGNPQTDMYGLDDLEDSDFDEIGGACL